jgi:tetratricopeptide (TPR) repeat protein
MALLRHGDSDLPAVCGNLGNSLLERFERTAQPDDLAEAKTMLERALSSDQLAPHARAVFLSCAASAWSAQFGLDQDLATLTTAIDLAGEALAAAPALEHRLRLLCNLAVHQHSYALRSGRPGPLAEAISNLRDALAATGTRDAQSVRVLMTLGAALRDHFQLTGDRASLAEAIECLDRALSLEPSDSECASAKSNLGVALTTLYAIQGDETALERGIAVLEHANAATPANHQERAVRLTNLANALRERSARTGAQADLDRSITILRQAADSTRASEMRSVIMSSLGVALMDRYHLDGEPKSLDQAVDALAAAVQSTPSGHGQQSKRMSNLGVALSTRGRLRGTRADVDRAVECQEAAVAAEVGPELHVRTSNLGAALLNRYRSTGSSADLNAAVAADRLALSLLPDNDPNRDSFLNGLGVALHELFRRCNDLAALDEAVSIFEQSVSGLPKNHTNYGKRHANLAEAAAARYRHSHQLASRGLALASWKKAAEAVATPTGVRCSAAAKLGRLAALSADWARASDGLREAVELLPRLAHRRVNRAVQESHLARHVGLVSDAAAAALSAGSPETAVELLEYGRAVLWEQLMQTRGDLTALAAAHPEVASRLHELRQALDPWSDADS